MKSLKQYLNSYINTNLGSSYSIDFGQGLDTTSLEKYIKVYYGAEFADDYASGDQTGSKRGKRMRQIVDVDCYARTGVYALDEVKDDVFNELVKYNRLTLGDGTEIEIRERNWNLVEQTDWQHGVWTIVVSYIQTVEEEEAPPEEPEEPPEEE